MYYIKFNIEGVKFDLLKYISPPIVVDKLIILNNCLEEYTSSYLKPIKILLLILSVFVEYCFDLCIIYLFLIINLFVLLFIFLYLFLILLFI